MFNDWVVCEPWLPQKSRGASDLGCASLGRRVRVSRVCLRNQEVLHHPALSVRTQHGDSVSRR